MKTPKHRRPLTICRDKQLLIIARQIRADEIDRTGRPPTLRRLAVLTVYHEAPSYYVEPTYLYRLWENRNCRVEKQFRAGATVMASRQRKLLQLMKRYVEEENYPVEMAVKLIEMQKAPRFYISVEWAMKLLKGRV